MGMLDGRVAVVTGGSKGLGAATARLFAAAGHVSSSLSAMTPRPPTG